MPVHSRTRAIAFSMIALFALSAPMASLAHAYAWHLRTLASFCADNSCSSYSEPSGALTLDASGDLFGVTSDAGIRGAGSVFELYRAPGKIKRKFRTIYNFCALNDCADGQAPNGGVVLATDGNLYGITADGGSAGGGTFFRLTPNRNGKNWILTTLYNFCTKDSACRDGGNPQGGLTYKGAAEGVPYDFSSPLYGTTASYAGHGAGAAYEMFPNNGRRPWKEKVLFRFCKEGGACPDGRGGSKLLLDSVGNLDGTSYTGINGSGLAYRLSPPLEGGKWTETMLYNFCSQEDCTDGADPSGGLVEDPAGNLFGLTEEGGNTSQCNGYGCGVLYEIAANGAETTLYQFCSLKKCRDGDYPFGAIYLDPAGALYGATLAGGKYQYDPYHQGGGTVFQFAGGSLATLRSFCAAANCPDGEEPIGSVIMDSAGDLFGTTQEGGAKNLGTVYQLAQ